MSVVSVTISAAGLSGPPLGAQTDLSVEVGASQIGPPLGLDSESARFAVGGIRASHLGLSGSGVHGSLLAGRTLASANGGDFLTADFGATMAEQWSSSVRGALDLRVLAFGVRAPYPYRAVAFEARPSITFDSRPVSLEVAAVAGSGRSRFEVWRVAGGPTRVFEDGLARIGGTTELTLGAGPMRFGVTGGLHKTPGGSFRSGGAQVLFAGGWGALELRADVWRTPVGTDTTGGLALMIPLSGWSVRGFFGRSEPDPLTLAQPGSTSGGALLGRSLYARAPGPRPGARPWEIVSATPERATIRLSVEAPARASRVALLGDFTLWEAVPMQRDGERWQVEVEVPVGTHHYGFLVDDEWYVPDDTRDVVPDEWGRVSAILVIEGADS
jgi:hypothetical protein